MSGVHTGMTNTKNTPIEALEQAYPLRVLRYRLRRGAGSGGPPGWRRASSGTCRCSRTCTVALITERRVSPALGPGGRRPGAPGENWLLPGGDEARAERLPDKCTVRLRAGDVLRMLTPGGGGGGSPLRSTAEGTVHVGRLGCVDARGERTTDRPAFS